MLNRHRENVSEVPGYQIWRRRVPLPLTPIAVQRQMKREKRLRLTELDRMLSPAAASALERWAACEQTLSGRAKTQSWENGGGSFFSEHSPIADYWIEPLKWHQTTKRGIGGRTLEILAAFTTAQNRNEGALTLAQYGLIYCPERPNKMRGFLQLIAEAADELIFLRY